MLNPFKRKQKEIIFICSYCGKQLLTTRLGSPVTCSNPGCISKHSVSMQEAMLRDNIFILNKDIKIIKIEGVKYET